jgi:hypothetical protein
LHIETNPNFDKFVYDFGSTPWNCALDEFTPDPSTWARTLLSPARCSFTNVSISVSGI